tara:strand:- start:240 stop:719 length:480 start_codon:yes stop_codon:yes gene_type:complete
MLSFRKIIFAILFLVPGCGFSPLYKDQNFDKFAGKISIQEPDNQNEFIFYSHLIDRFDESNGTYTLTYAITTSKKDSGLNFDGTVHRIEISGSVAFSLKDTESGFELLSDKERMYLSYSNFGSTAAVLNAERTTNKQLLVLLADKVADRISLIIIEKSS